MPPILNDFNATINAATNLKFAMFLNCYQNLQHHHFFLWIDIDPTLHTHTVHGKSILDQIVNLPRRAVHFAAGCRAQRNHNNFRSVFFFCTAQNRQNLRKIVAMAGIELHKFDQLPAKRVPAVPGWLVEFCNDENAYFFSIRFLALEAFIRWHCFKKHTNLALNYANFVQILALITLIKPKNKGTKTKPTTRFISSFRTAPNHNFFHLFRWWWDGTSRTIPWRVYDLPGWWGDHVLRTPFGDAEMKRKEK